MDPMVSRVLLMEVQAWWDVLGQLGLWGRPTERFERRRRPSERFKLRGRQKAVDWHGRGPGYCCSDKT